MMKRANKMVISLAAVLSLFVSVVSACACSHHQSQVKTDPPSCHSSSHGEPAAAADEPASTETFGAGCNCFVNTPAPAITAKSEKKRFSYEKHLGALAALVIPDAIDLQPRYRHADGPESPPSFFKGQSLSFGPPRAPPRL